MTARFRCIELGTREKSLASKPGATAMASTPPVRGSSTIAVPSSACHLATVVRSTDSTFAWSVWSSVRKTSRPGCSGVELTTSIVRPNGSRTIVSFPGLPARSRSRPTSSPARPLLSTPAYPSTCDATVCCG